MLAALALMALTADAPQDAAVDRAVFEDATYGVALPRPFDDWVFAPATSRGTTTVIFHPRGGALSDQLWGALVLTTFDRDVPLGQVADQRVETSWQPLLGPSFRLLTRDSIAVRGLPAVHVVMAGAIDFAVLDVEEYLIARGGDLILLQFRYPRHLPRDSIAAGYQRVMDGLRILGGTAPRPAEPPPPPPPIAVVRALAGSPWQVTTYDVLVRFDAVGARFDAAARLTVRNEGFAPQDTVTLAVLPPAVLDSVAVLPLPARAAGPSVARIGLPAPSGPQDERSVAAYLHLDAPPPAFGAVGALVDRPWLPLAASPFDTAGRALRIAHPRLTLRFDLPDSLRAVAPGRLTSEAVALGRRHMTWTDEGAGPLSATFVVGSYQAGTRRSGRVTVRLWRPMRPDTAPPGRTEALLDAVDRGLALLGRMFGPPALDEVAVVEADRARGSRSPGLVLVAPDLTAVPDVLLRDLARLWWGGAVHAHGEGAAFVLEGLPAWVAVAARGVLEGDSVRQRLVREAEAHRDAERGRDRRVALGDLDPYSAEGLGLIRAVSVAALEAVRRTIGEARLREALRRFAVHHRGGTAGLADFLPLLGPDGSATLRSHLLGR